MSGSVIPPGGDLFAPTPTTSPDPYIPDRSLPPAWLVDADGTLALGRFSEPGRRRPFDWHRVHEDDPNPPVIAIVQALHTAGHRIIVMSGRSDACRDLTLQWLAMHFVPHHELLMRADGDFRDDRDVKAELFDRHVRDRYHVIGALDDRDKIVDFWRGIGLVCLQVAPGAF